MGTIATEIRFQTVEEFFNQANWLGVKIAPPSESVSWADQTVEEFFKQGNWFGIIVPKEEEESVSQRNPLTVSVGEFWESVSWGGVPQVAVASPKLVNASTNAHEEFKVSDLSDLF